MDMAMLALDDGAPKSLQEAKDRDNFGIKTGPDGKSLWIPPPDTSSDHITPFVSVTFELTVNICLLHVDTLLNYKLLTIV